VTEARDELVARVTRNLEGVRERIAAVGADPTRITIVAVTKTFGPEAAAAALAAGIGDVAENYADELVAKHDALGEAALRWHYLGRLQRNKLARLAPRVAVYQTVSSAAEAAALAARAPAARCYLQVDVTGLPGRLGCRPQDAPAIAAAAGDAGLALEGLMCVADPDPRLAEGQFSSLRDLADALGLAGCSMGMSGDFEAACRAGATMLRLGTVLFGDRASPRSGSLA